MSLVGWLVVGGISIVVIVLGVMYARHWCEQHFDVCNNQKCGHGVRRRLIRCDPTGNNPLHITMTMWRYECPACGNKQNGYI